jgi:putative transposase
MRNGYERGAARRDTRADHCQRGLQTKAGEVRLRVPKLRRADVRDGDLATHRSLKRQMNPLLMTTFTESIS